MTVVQAPDPYNYESRINRPVRAKLPELDHHGRLKHVIFSEQFERQLLDHLARTATMIRAISRTKSGAGFLTQLLPHRRAMLYFTQPSTRTYLSFVAASQILGMSYSEIRDPRV